MEELTSKPVKTNSVDGLKLSWRDHKYRRFYEIVDRLVDEIQKHVWVKTGKPKRRLKGDGLEKLHYSVECLVRDCMAVVLQRKRKSDRDSTIKQIRTPIRLLAQPESMRSIIDAT